MKSGRLGEIGGLQRGPFPNPRAPGFDHGSPGLAKALPRRRGGQTDCNPPGPGQAYRLGAQSHQAGLVQSSWEGLAVAVQEAPLAAQFALPNSE